MKLRSLKIGALILSPKKVLSIIGALFILGIGIGATVASHNSSKLALVFCSIIAIVILLVSFSKSDD